MHPCFSTCPIRSTANSASGIPSTFTVSKDRTANLVGHYFDPNNEHGDASGTMTFGCAEQFVMFCKADRFRDHNTQRRVMATGSSKEQEQVGKLVRGFYAGFWGGLIKSDVVIAGNEAKFGQNVTQKQKLLATGHGLLAEAASRDPVWGISYSEKNAMSHRQDWGENRLSKALMVVRERLREDSGEDSDHSRQPE